MIGYFLKEAWQGIVDIVVGPLTAVPRPDLAAKADPVQAPKKSSSKSPRAPNGSGHRAAPLAVPVGEASVAHPASNAQAVSAPDKAEPVKAAAKSEPPSAAADGGEIPGSPVAQRYRTLKAEGLAPKHASEFSRSAKKYTLFRTLSTTRPHDGAAVYWELVKGFEQKTAEHADKLKSAGAPKQKIANFKTEAGRARDFLIQQYVQGKDALAEADAAFVQDIAKTIGFSGA